MKYLFTTLSVLLFFFHDTNAQYRWRFDWAINEISDTLNIPLEFEVKQFKVSKDDLELINSEKIIPEKEKDNWAQYYSFEKTLKWIDTAALARGNFIIRAYVGDSLIQSEFSINKLTPIDNNLVLSGLDTTQLLRDSSNYLTLNHSIDIQVSEGDEIEFQQLNFQRLEITNSNQLSQFHIDRCHIADGYLDIEFARTLDIFSMFSIRNSTVDDIAVSTRKANQFSFFGTHIRKSYFELEDVKNLMFINNKYILSDLRSVDEILFDSLFISGVFDSKFNSNLVTFNLNQVDLAWLYQDTLVGEDLKPINIDNRFNEITFKGSAESIKISESYLPLSLNLTSLIIDKSLDIGNNTFSLLCLEDISFNDIYVNLPVYQFQSNPPIYIKTDANAYETTHGYITVSEFPYFGQIDRELNDYVRFLKLIRAYTQLYNIAKENGDIQSFNRLYAGLQALYTARYKVLAKSTNNLESHFRWRLNQILEFYVDYGTNPAKALVISFYIILAFSIFYFFFPSEWDKEPKDKLWANLKSAINKNESGTIKAILSASWLLILSFINAFTLSLNSFVTLGFGTIPTSGLARYICIIQGFMGWFLLSLFSVALINQVIF